MIVCLDLEGVLVPEIWIAFSKKTGIEKLRLTTRDVSDYNELMRSRLKILDENHLKLSDVQEVIRSIHPLDGAKDFLSWLKSEFQVIILSDTFNEFAAPLMKKLDYPTLFCNSLKIGEDGHIVGFFLRQKDGKTKAVRAFKSLNLSVIAAGDSYNDTGMLQEANAGILFRPPQNVIDEFPQFPVTQTYDEFRETLLRMKKSLANS